MKFKDLKRIETERLIIRPFKESDLDDFFEYAKSPNVSPSAGWKPHETIEESQYILERFINGEEVMAIVYKANGKVIGSVGMHKDEKRSIDTAKMIGYVLSENYWGRGLMTECVRAVLDAVFVKTDLNIVSVMHFPFNVRSRRVIEKCGFRYEGTLRLSYRKYNGEILDEVCYSILRSEWEDKFISKTAL
jgi:putative acetyltransferase